MEIKKNIIRCPKCNKILGEYDGRIANAFCDIHITGGKVYFGCNKDFSEVWVCNNNENTQLKHNRQIKI
jgi:hypothetical protein